MKFTSTHSSIADDHRLISEATASDIYRRLKQNQRGEGLLRVSISAWWEGKIQWARNRATVSDDRRDISVIVTLSHKYGGGTVKFNQIDDQSITAVMRAIERDRDTKAYMWGSAEMYYNKAGLVLPPEWLPYPETKIWSDATFAVTPEQRASVARVLNEGAKEHGLLSAGSISMRVTENYRKDERAEDRSREQVVDSASRGVGGDRQARVELAYQRASFTVCSMTVRHPKGVGSGWAGLSSFDWATIDPEGLANRALEKCLRSLNPVAVEPGRYTVVLEPQALHSLITPLIRAMNTRLEQEEVERPRVLSLDVDPSLMMRMTKLGLKIIDERITISHDPMDPRLGIPTHLGMTPVTWVKNGVLQALAHDRAYALKELNKNLPDSVSSGFKMSGGTTTIDEMIETTQRGLLVTRFSSVRSVPSTDLSLLYTGLTRDGLWLIENGKISKSVKNMRFTDSPLFVLNQVVQLGEPVPVLAGMSSPAVVPPIKSNDFAFTATIDAI